MSYAPRRMDQRTIYDAACRDLASRTQWESKQGDLYKARYRGLRRTNMPWPGASDTNWPLVDTIITKLAPHYFQQLFATDLLASFAPGVGEETTPQMATSAAQLFDYVLKQESNLEPAILHTIDAMLMWGRPVVKCIWDHASKGIRFVPIIPTRIIVPSSTTDLETADRIVHVLTYSPEAYRRVPGYKQGEEFLRTITGSGASQDSHVGDGAVRDPATRRKGITEGEANEVIVWEAWVLKDNGKYEVRTFSPLRPDVAIKPAHESPYGGSHPFVDFPHEVTGEDWYAPRGVGEIVLPYQAQLTKLLNEKNDAMTLGNRPMFVAETGNPNTANLRFRPGQILPQGVKPAVMAQPPISFDVHINLMRSVAEQLVAMPDFGMTHSGDIRKARTATEIEQISAVNQQSSDLRMRIFRMSLGRLYRKAWNLLRQFAKDRLRIVVDDTVTEIPADAFRWAYSIKPSGSADGVTRATLWRQAVGRMQMFTGNPFVDQGELVKTILESDQAGLVKRLFRDPGIHQADQTEEQAMEIGVIKLGIQATVSPADDHATHIRTILNYIATAMQNGMPPSPVESQLLQMHAAQHMAALRKSNPEMAKQAEDAFAVTAQMMQPKADGAQEVGA